MNVHCTIIDRQVNVWRGQTLIGHVAMGGPGDNEPVFYFEGGNHLTFNDIAIIQDNWNQSEIMRAEREAELKLQAEKGVNYFKCPYCHHVSDNHNIADDRKSGICVICDGPFNIFS